MPRIGHFVFWTGGVLLPRISDLSLKILCEGDSPMETILELNRLESALASGKISPDEYCRKAIEISRVGIRREELCARIESAPQVEPGMLDLLEELCGNYDLKLVSDYPREWLIPILRRTGFRRWFVADNMFFLAEHSHVLEGERLFPELMAAAVLFPGKSLWVDYISSRTSSAIRRGIDAAIFVDARRLRRDLSLWGLVV